MTPASSRRLTLSAALGAERPTRRAKSAMLIRASLAKADRMRASTASRSEFRFPRRFIDEPFELHSVGRFGLSTPIYNGSIDFHTENTGNERGANDMARSQATLTNAANLAPPHAWFAVSAIFHYLGPSFAVLLFPSVGVLGVAWMRIAAAAAIFAPWTAPWRTIARADGETRRLLIGLGVCLAVMNTSFYLALDRLPMSLVAAIEFVGTIGVALYGLRTARNLAALGLAVLGVSLLINVRWSSDPIGLFWAFLNGVLFVGYIVLGHRISEGGASGGV